MATPPKASLPDTLRVAGGVLAPVIAQGVIRRRPRLVRFAARHDLDGRAVATLLRLRRRYGDGPVMLRVPGRRIAVPLGPGQVGAVLAASPEPFALATTEKRAALEHFQPHGVLATRGALRGPRRAVNEAVLDTHSPVHRLGPAITRVVAEEADALWSGKDTAVVSYDDYAAAFHRAVRRVVLGDAARDDDELARTLDRLRDAANWAYLRPRRTALRGELADRLRDHVDRAEPGSLAAEVALQRGLPDAADVDPAGQIPQWLFAFDAAAIASARVLAVVATHPAQGAELRREIGDRDLAEPQYLPRFRGAMHESVRLWPTTQVVLRETTGPADLDGVTLPERTQLVVVSGFFHRDPASVPHADRFAPEAWREGRDAGAPAGAVIPFSDGPGRCPGENLVLLVTTAFAGRLLQRGQVQLNGTHGLDPEQPLPGTLDPFRFRFRLTPR
jgi:cytochrome P450